MYSNVFIDKKNLRFQFSYSDFETDIRVYITVQKQKKKYSSNISYSRADSKIWGHNEQ